MKVRYSITTMFVVILASGSNETLLAAEIRVTSIPTGATVYVNKEAAKRPTPCFLTVDQGDTIHVRRAGYKIHESKVTANTEKLVAKLKEITKFKLLLETKTSDRKNAGTDDLKLVLQLNGNADEQRPLNHKGDDRRVGARDKYTLEFDCPEEKLKGFRVAVLAGADAWKCDYFAARLVKDDDSTTQVFLFNVNGWFSADAKEGKRYYDATFRRLKFEFPKPEPDKS